MYPKIPSATSKPPSETSSSKYGGFIGAMAYPNAAQLPSPIYTANHETARLRSRNRKTIDVNKIPASTYNVSQSKAGTDAMMSRRSGLEGPNSKSDDKTTTCDAAIKPTTIDMTQTSLGRETSTGSMGLISEQRDWDYGI